MSTELLRNSLQQLCPAVDIKSCEQMAWHTFTRTGGAADLFVQPTTFDEVIQIVKAAKQLNLPLTTLGYGTNVIVRDSGIRGVVMNMNKLSNITVDDTTITAQSGAGIIHVSRIARDHHLTGLEFACGIPGSVGGALMMNAGAYGGEVSYVLKEATVLDGSGNIIVLDHTQFNFGYRSSIFEQEHYIVLEAIFELAKDELAVIQAKMDENTMLRESKQPLEYPSCGSVFKRPPNMFAGKLISDSGLKGTRIGGAEVSTKHAGFIVNVDQATSTDYLQLIKHVQQTIWDNYQVKLETEVKIIGDSNEQD